jgi:hypothetical protein
MNRLVFIKQILLSLLIISLVYFFFCLNPRAKLTQDIRQARLIIGKHQNLLVQNRLAYVELTRLDPDPSQNYNRTELVSTINSTITEGIKLSQSENRIPQVDENLTTNFPNLLKNTEDIYKTQQQLLSSVFSTDQYLEGQAILRSDEAIKLLTNETNLILEYQYWQNKLSSFLDQ